jgi:NAD(P)-dependent dehydrogenase (short-subunit alcohol dehydrogenase family)
MKSKTILITGANAGIGKAAAIQMAKKGHTVIIGCRNEERGNKALEDINKASANSATELLIIDLASKESIRKAASTIIKKHKTIDVLIHNAADFDISRKTPLLSADVIENVWATNHLGPALLTKLLLEQIKSSKDGRILTIASKGLIMYPNLQIDIKDPEFKERKFSVAKAYYQSKLAQLMYTYWLAEELRGTSATANCIRVTNVKVDVNRYPNLSRASKFVYGLKSSFSMSPERMAEIYTLLATEENLKTVTGKYFDEKNKIVKSSKYSLDKDNITKLMNLTNSYI